MHRCIVALLIGLFGAVQVGVTQVCPPEQSSNWFVSYITNPLCYPYWQQVDDHEAKEPEQQRELLRAIADSVLTDNALNYYRLRDTLRDTELIYFYTQSGKLREFQVLIDKAEYMILCLNTVNDMCNCNADLFLYHPANDMLKRVERAFSFSIKNNLIDRLNEYVHLELLKDDFDSTCEVLSSL